jgi:hypothetical protein
MPRLCFARPLTDGLIEQYRTLIDSLDSQSPLRDALDALWQCCHAWWQIPDPVGTAKKTLDVTIHDKHGNPLPSPQLQMMDGDHVRQLWDLVPWEHELEAIKPLLLQLDADAAERNAERENAWRNEVELALFAKLLPGEDRDVFLTALLWHVIELDHDQEPLTSDKL